MDSIKARYAGGVATSLKTEAVVADFLDSLGFRDKDDSRGVELEIFLRSMPIELHKMRKTDAMEPCYIVSASTLGLMLYYFILPAESKEFGGDGFWFIPFENISAMRPTYFSMPE